MLDFKCSTCGQSFHGSAELEFSENENCPECGGILAPADDGGRKAIVHVGGTACKVRESDLKELTKANYQRSGFTHALRVYRSLFPDVSFEDAKATVKAWCGNLKEGSVLYVSNGE